MDKETKEALAELEERFVGLLKEIKESKAGGKNGPHAVMACPVCEEPARLIFDNGIILTCRKCGGLTIRFEAVVLRKGDPEKFLEHGKTEALLMLHGSKELEDALLNGDAEEVRKVVVSDKRASERAAERDGLLSRNERRERRVKKTEAAPEA